MTTGRHTMPGYDHVGRYIRDQNQSRECVTNGSTFDLNDAFIGAGNGHDPEVDKSAEFGLTPGEGEKVGAPLFEKCYANVECKLVDDSQAKKYGLFVFEWVKAHVATSPKTVHNRGDGVFMIAGENMSHRQRFKPEMP